MSRHENLLKEISEELMNSRLQERPKTPPVRDYMENKSYPINIQGLESPNQQNVNYSPGRTGKYYQTGMSSNAFEQYQTKGNNCLDMALKLKEEIRKEKERFLQDCQSLEGKIKQLLEEDVYQQSAKSKY